MIKITILIILLAGCAEYGGLWVDTSCSDQEYFLVETAVDKLNLAVGDDLVYVAGWVDEDDFAGVGPGSRDVVRCLPEDADLDGRVGEVVNDDVYLVSRGKDDCFLGTLMHELGHLYAGAWHVADADAIMYQYSSCLTEYNESDIREFRSRLQ